jgi:aminopeptidase C
MSDSEAIEFPIWRTPEGEPVSCVEKIKVLNENLAELRELAQEALEDAVLMGCDEGQVREVLAGIVAGAVNPYRK